MQTTPIHSPFIDWRQASRAQLTQGLQDLRSCTLSLFDAFAAAGRLALPYHAEFNPPLWELGHVAWFQEYWVVRNAQRHLGLHFNGVRTVIPSMLAGADNWYNSTTVAHASRWTLPLLQTTACKNYLADTLAQTLGCLQRADETDQGLYFYRLVLLHEAMHLEANTYIAQALGVQFPKAAAQASAVIGAAKNQDDSDATNQLCVKKQVFTLGYQNPGFAFDNELLAHPIAVDAFEIDSRCVNWQAYLCFAQATQRELPRYLRRTSHGYEKNVFGIWQTVDLQDPAVHVNLQDATAYCAWAGRRLPTEVQWELAASTADASQFVWGEVWEWTADTFAPYEGFVPHPYQDYSMPWFGTRQVLRGASRATLDMVRHVKYRNYFTPDRTDIFAGFRTCKL